MEKNNSQKRSGVYNFPLEDQNQDARIQEIESKIPSAASEENKLTDELKVTNGFVASPNVRNIVVLTQEEYDHLDPADPNTLYIIGGKVVYDAPKGYSKQYLTFEALEDGTIEFDIIPEINTDKVASVSYSTDNGATWITTNNQDDKEENLQIVVNVQAGDKVLWKGSAAAFAYGSDSGDGLYIDGGCFFTSSNNVNVYGNIMSLLYGDAFIGKTELEEELTFAWLFADYNENNEPCKIVDASNLILPATTLSDGCYEGMFATVLLLHAPKVLPALTLAYGCYEDMFSGCSSLISPPELPATTLYKKCYNYMFNGCSSLTKAPELKATVLAENCYEYMFDQCETLTAITCLATDISAEECTDFWTNSVAPTGIFIKAASMDDWVTGNFGIPEGWAVCTEEEYNELKTPLPLIIEVGAGDTEVPAGTHNKISTALALGKDVIVKYIEDSDNTDYLHIKGNLTDAQGFHHFFQCVQKEFYYYIVINSDDTCTIGDGRFVLDNL